MPDDLTERMARMEGELKAMEAKIDAKQAEYKTEIAILAKAMADDRADQRVEAARRETRLIVAVLSGIGLGVAILKFLP